MTFPTILGSQDPLDLLPDPLPYVDRVTGERRARPGYLTTFFSPRPQYQLELPHPPNFALVDMRYRRDAAKRTGEMNPQVFYRGIVEVIDASQQYSAREKDHAKRVAARLMAVA